MSSRRGRSWGKAWAVPATRCLDEVQRLGPDGLDEFDWSLVPKIEAVS